MEKTNFTGMRSINIFDVRTNGHLFSHQEVKSVENKIKSQWGKCTIAETWGNPEKSIYRCTVLYNGKRFFVWNVAKNYEQ